MLARYKIKSPNQKRFCEPANRQFENIVRKKISSKIPTKHRK